MSSCLRVLLFCRSSGFRAHLDIETRELGSRSLLSFGDEGGDEEKDERSMEKKEEGRKNDRQLELGLSALSPLPLEGKPRTHHSQEASSDLLDHFLEDILDFSVSEGFALEVGVAERRERK